MKKQLTVALGLAVLATPAFASKARLQALGESVNGSQYINDNRNIFLNAAHVNNHKDLVTFETGASSAVADTAATPRAEGGYFFGHNNMVYGIQLGEQSDVAHTLRLAGLNAGSIATATTTDVAERNAIDLFVGGDAGMKWGASFLYASSEDKSATAAQAEKNDSMRVRLGASHGNWDAFANVSITNEVELANGNKFEGSAGYQLGGSYLLNDYTIFANYSSFSGEGTISGTKEDVSLGQMEIGVGRAAKLNDRSHLFTKISYRQNTQKDDAEAAGNLSNFGSEKLTTTALPLVIGLEYDATSWLTLRGSVTQNVLINEIKGQDKNSDESTTVVNAGASLKFGDFVIDGVIGNVDERISTTGGDTSGGTTVGSGTGTGTLRLDTLMTRVSMTYRF